MSTSKGTCVVDTTDIWKAIEELQSSVAKLKNKPEPPEGEDVVASPDVEPDPDPPTEGVIPEDLANREPDTFKSWKTWETDARFVGITKTHPHGDDWQDWGSWCAGKSGKRLLIENSAIRGGEEHRGQPWRGWSEYYFKGVIFDGLQWSTESNAGSKRGAMINVTFRNVGEDAIRDVYGHIENVVVESVDPLPGDPHCDTIDWKSDIPNAGVIKNVKSTTGKAHGIITAGVKNLVIDGFEHVYPGNAGWSIQFGGDVENITIRNCKLGGNIVFRGAKKNVNIDWDTVRINVPREEFA